MIRAVFGSNDSDSDDWRLTLTSPTEVLAAHSTNEVTQLVQAAEDAAHRGSYVALMLTYEAAAAFDPALITHPRNSKLPLAWAAVFPEATNRYSDPERASTYCTSEWQPGINESEYRAAVERVLELIAAGQTYQVNYSFPMAATFKAIRLHIISTSVAHKARATPPFSIWKTFKFCRCHPNSFLNAKVGT